ncbi:MAG TPA: nitroreductase family protein [Chloroflexota bacterium]|nr:nitroreductase family protein [Chloroflexota bacterium]
MTIAADLADALDAVLAGRRSIRTYEERAVPPDVLERVLAAAAQAPSPHHSMPWRLAVLTGQAAKSALAGAMGEKWRADLLGDGLRAAEIEVELEKSRRRLTASPVVIVGSVYHEVLDEYPDAARQQAETLMAAHSLGAALQNVMLAAHANGLASCWMCAPVFCSDVVRDALNLPSDLIPHAIVTMGYPARPPRARERPSVDQIVVLRA